MSNVLTLFGTRPEVVKLAPVIRELEARGAGFETTNVASGQHRELVEPFARLFNLRIDHDLALMRPGQSPARLCARILEALDPLLEAVAPDLVLVQGDGAVGNRFQLFDLDQDRGYISRKRPFLAGFSPPRKYTEFRPAFQHTFSA